MVDITRRTLLKVASGLTGATAGGSTAVSEMDDPAVVIGPNPPAELNNNTMADNIGDHVYQAQSVSELPDPPQVDPAVGVTDEEGAVEYDRDKERWITPDIGSRSDPDLIPDAELGSVGIESGDINALTTDELTTEESVTVSGDNTIAYGRDHGETAEGNNVAIGVGAAALPDTNQTVSGNDPRKVAVGYEAAKNDEQFGTVAVGQQTARENTGNRIAAVGYEAARNNPGNHVAAVGYEAAKSSTQNAVVGMGYKAAKENTGKGTVAMGYKAGEFNSGNGAFCIGFQAGQNNSGNNAVALGNRAGRGNTAPKLVAVGFRAGQDNTGDNVSASGVRAAQNNNSDNVVVRGVRSAQNNTGKNLVAAGHLTAQDNTGDNVTALGHLAARYNYANDVVSIGNLSSRNNTGDRVVAIGVNSARGDGLLDPTTMGSDNIGIGDSAIRNNQASGLIAIGQEAGRDATTDDQLIITQQDGTRRMVMDLTTGDLKISGTVTENASL